MCISGQKLSKRDVEVLVKWLSRDCAVVLSDGQASSLIRFAIVRLRSDQVIKLLESGRDTADHPINESDRGTLAIVQTLAQVEAQIANIDAQITRSVPLVL